MRNPRASRPTVRLAVAAAALLAALPGCRSSTGRSEGAEEALRRSPVGDMTLDRGDWLMGQSTGVWKVEVPADEAGKPPQRIGYVTARQYREVRGGPVFTMYEVSSLDRKEIVGIVDSLGNAKRFRVMRDGRTVTEDAGNSTLALSVQAIFETLKPVALEKTTERALAFEALDVNKDGFLDANEFPRLKDRFPSPDTNGDGKIDVVEFENARDL